MNHTNSPGPASTFMQQTPFDEGQFLLKAQGFLQASPSATVKMVLVIIGYRPGSWKAWALLFKAALAVQSKKKVIPLIEMWVGWTKKIRTLQDGAKIIQHHPTNNALWSKVLALVRIKEDRALEEIVLRIMLDCDHTDPAVLVQLSDFLLAKATLLARGKEQAGVFQEASLLIGMAVSQMPTSQELRKKQTDILATATAFVGGWEEVHAQGGTYRNVMVAFENPESVGWKLPSSKSVED